METEQNAINEQFFIGSDEIDYEIPENIDDEKISTAKSLGTQWLAGHLSNFFKNDETKTSGEAESSQKFQSDSVFLTKSMKRGNIMKPSDSFLEIVTKMDKIFCCYHPKVVSINYIKKQVFKF